MEYENHKRGNDVTHRSLNSVLLVLVIICGTYTARSDNSDVGYGSGALQTIGNCTNGYCLEPTGIDNSAFGYGALFYTLTGNHNTGVGTQALNFNSSGSWNTASGFASLYFNSTGSYNTSTGAWALAYNTTGVGNTADGYQALYASATGGYNTAFGYEALAANSGSNNVALGASALAANTTGENNNAAGFQSLYANTSGYNNNAAGFDSLYSNSIGNRNNAMGVQSLYSNTTADDNNAMGFAALFGNTTGYRNNAVGSQAMYFNTVGFANNAQGYMTLYRNTSGTFNNAVGYLALYNNTTGSYNVAIGQYAGYNQTSGSSDIYIANQGVAAESGVIRIGAPSTQTAAYIAGISNSRVTGAAVYVTSSGQLGVLASSERYKVGIASMGTNTQKLGQLRPVSFHLKTEPNGVLQYGLIAEEVERIYPELVIRDDSGKIQGVRYDELAPILVNEVQQQQKQLLELKQQFAEMAETNRQMQAALLALQAKKSEVAMR